MIQYQNVSQVDNLLTSLDPLVRIVESSCQNGVILYGAGFLGQWASQYFQSLGIQIRFFLDSDESKNNTTINTIKIYKPTQKILQHISVVIITARHAIREISTYLNSIGVLHISFDALFVAQNYGKFSRVRDNLLHDQFSIETYNSLLLNMLIGELTNKHLIIKDMYFCLPEFSGNFNESFVDAGAFVGDSIEKFIWENLGTFQSIIAFEPGHRQFLALEARMKRLINEWAINPDSVCLVQAGLSDTSSQMATTFIDDYPLRHGLQQPDHSSELCQLVPVVCLDEFLEQRKVTFLKVDIEGMEMQFLKGAKETIVRWKPKIAICVYHYPCDLYVIPEYIHSLVPEYKFSLRHHAPVHGDYVLYCYL